MLRMILPPLLAVLGGLGGFFLRRWELATAFDQLGLPVPATATTLLILLSVLLALAFGLLCRGGRKPDNCGKAFSAPGNWLYVAVSVLGGACLLGAALLGLRGGLSGERALLAMLLWAMCLLSFFCVLKVVWDNFRGKVERFSLFRLAPAYTCCLWLVVAYQQRAADPVILDYVYELFAIVCTLLGLYFTAGFSYGRPRVWLCALFSLLGVYFSVVTLADYHDTSNLLLYLFAILYQLAAVTTLLYHAFAERPEAPSIDPNPTQEVIPDEQ